MKQIKHCLHFFLDHKNKYCIFYYKTKHKQIKTNPCLKLKLRKNNNNAVQ